MNNCSRPFGETMEYIIKPRRRNDLNRSNTSPNLNSGSSENSTIENRENIETPQPPTPPYNSASNLYPSLPSTSEELSPGEVTTCNDDDVTVIYDSRLDGPVYSNRNEETESTASTTLSSTDSNKGIVHDIYNNCFICARPLNDTLKPVATLPSCMHPFHESCLTSVLKWHPKCPVCDFHIFSPI